MIRFIIRYFLVLLIVALIHLIAFVSGSIRSSPAVELALEHEPVCTMAFRRGPYALPGIVAWSALVNPTLFALPDYDDGFSAMISFVLPACYSPTPSRPLPVPFEPVVLMPAPNMNDRLPEIAEPLELVGMSLSEAEGSITGDAFPQRRILWMWEDGTVIADSPNLNSQLNGLDFADSSPARETRIAILPESGRYRLVLEASCGLPELDGLALAALGPELSALEGTAGGGRFMGRPLPAHGMTIRVDWRMHPVWAGEDS